MPTSSATFEVGPAAIRHRLIGSAAALVTILIWAMFIVVTRFGVTGSLTMWDVAFLRYAPTTFLLLPLCLRHRGALASAGATKLTVMAVGGGMPFLLIGMSGMLFAPAAHAGALMPGSMPLFVALLSLLVFGERFAASRLAGFALIVAGVIAIGGYHLFLSGGGLWRGHLLFLTAAALWACYTLALKRAGLPALPVIAFIYVVGGALYIPVYLLALPSGLTAAPWPDILLQLAQGILSGVVSLWTYSLAVQKLGPTRAAAFGALAPALAALAAIPLLGEWPDAAAWIGIPAIVLGVALANGALSIGKPAGYASSNRQGG